MVNKIKNILILTIVSIIFGCSNSAEISEKIIPKNVNDFAKTFIENIQNGNIDTCLLVVDSELNNEEGREYLMNLYKNIKFFKAKSIKIAGYNITKFFGSDGCTNYLIDYEYDYGKFVYFSFNIKEQNDRLTIYGFNGQILDKSLSEINKFTFSEKRFLHYLFLFFLIIIPIFIITTIVFIAKTPMKRKWLWIIGAFIGIMSFNLNWTTGDFGFQFMTFRLFGIGFAKSGFASPWIASFTLPIIAIIFWIKRQSFIVNAEFEQNILNKSNEISKTENIEKFEVSETIVND
jgi:hypothetical protein